MITPKEIHDKEFKRSLRGYDLDDVDKFLDIIIKDFEKLYLENASLKEECDKSEKKLNQYLGMETSINRALLLAEKTAENVKMEAKIEKDNIISEARETAIQIINKAKEDAKSFNTVNQELITKSENFKHNLIELFEKQISNIKEHGSMEEISQILKEKEELINPEEVLKEKLEESVLQEFVPEENTKDVSNNFLGNELLDNGLLDEEEEEFKNKVFKFLEK